MSLLDEAFIEAKALKDAARQQAQTDIIEKYAEEIKGNMSQLLERQEMDLGFGLDEADEDEDEFGLGLGTPDEDPMGGMGDEFDFEDDLELTDSGDNSYLDNQVPHGYASGEKLCDCPDDEEEIEINFDDLMSAGEEEDPMSSPETFDREEEMGDIMGDEDEEFLEEFEVDDSLFEQYLDDSSATSPTIGSDEEEFEMDDEGADSNTFYQYHDEPISEELVADTEEKPSGWSPRDGGSFDDEFDKLLARLSNPGKKDDSPNAPKKPDSSAGDVRTRDDVNDHLKENFKKIYEDNKTLHSTLGKIKKEKERFLKEIKVLRKKTTNYESTLEETADLLQILNLENTKLVLQKKVFENISLNERQKHALVEAISDAETPEEAKRVFKLQGTVGAGSKKRPKSQNPLTEALQRKPTASSVLQQGRRAKENETTEEMLNEAQYARMKKLAGL